MSDDSIARGMKLFEDAVAQRRQREEINRTQVSPTISSPAEGFATRLAFELLDPRPGQIVHVSLSDELTYYSIEAMEALRDELQDLVPEGVRVLVTTPGVEVSVEDAGPVMPPVALEDATYANYAQWRDLVMAAVEAIDESGVNLNWVASELLRRKSEAST